MNEDPLLESGLTKLSNASGVSYPIFYNHSILFETWPTSFHAPSFFLDCLKWNLNCQFSPYSKPQKVISREHFYIEHRYEQMGARGTDTCNQLSTETYPLSNSYAC